MINAVMSGSQFFFKNLIVPCLTLIQIKINSLGISIIKSLSSFFKTEKIPTNVKIINNKNELNHNDLQTKPIHCQAQAIHFNSAYQDSKKDENDLLTCQTTKENPLHSYEDVECENEDKAAPIDLQGKAKKIESEKSQFSNYQLNLNSDQAAQKIQGAWRRYKLKKLCIDIDKKEPLYFAIKKLKDISNIELGEGKFDNEIQSCLNRIIVTRDVGALRYLTYALFSGKRSFISMKKERLALLNSLALSEEERSDSQLQETVELIKKLLKMRQPIWAEPVKPKYPPKVQATIDKEEGEILEKELHGSTWCNKVDVPKDRKVFISHGGGLYYICQFLRGRVAGYEASEYVGKGIFVSPSDQPGGSTRDDYYANWKPQHFDIPAKFTAEIEACHLGAVDNGYEAVLRPEKIKYLKNISIQLSPISKNGW